MSLILKKLANEVGKKLKQEKLRLATVESCTGGGVAYWITSIAGSSDWFERGFVTYSAKAKIQLIGVNEQTIKTFGEVSEQTAKEMAEGGLKHSLADVCVSITGIAGPGGGSEEKPVGTVWMSWAKKDNPTRTVCYFFSGDREEVRTQSIEAALNGLLV